MHIFKGGHSRPASRDLMMGAGRYACYSTCVKDYSDPAWILQSAEDQQRFWLCLASLASQDVAAAFGLRV